MGRLKTILVLLLFFLATSVFSQTVFITNTGEKFHMSSCHYLKNSKNEITYENALASGYTACSVCKPPKEATTPQSFTTSQQETDPEATSTKQCSGKTKAGARCKRMTKSTTGRCYQH